MLLGEGFGTSVADGSSVGGYDHAVWIRDDCEIDNVVPGTDNRQVSSECGMGVCSTRIAQLFFATISVVSFLPYTHVGGWVGRQQSGQSHAIAVPPSQFRVRFVQHT